MIRAFNLGMLALTVMICFGLYRVTHAAQEREGDLKRVEAQIGAQQRAIDVLKAEWTHLSQPAKMQAMAARYLNLQPMKATQIAYLTDIPMRPEGVGTMSDISAIPFAKENGQPVYDASAPVPQAKPAGVGR